MLAAPFITRSRQTGGCSTMRTRHPVERLKLTSSSSSTSSRSATCAGRCKRLGSTSKALHCRLTGAPCETSTMQMSCFGWAIRRWLTSFELCPARRGYSEERLAARNQATGLAHPHGFHRQVSGREISGRPRRDPIEHSARCGHQCVAAARGTAERPPARDLRCVFSRGTGSTCDRLAVPASNGRD